MGFTIEKILFCEVFGRFAEGLLLAVGEFEGKVIDFIECGFGVEVGGAVYKAFGVNVINANFCTDKFQSQYFFLLIQNVFFLPSRVVQR